ncbi:MAG: SDR family oxidoreductase [Chloroflexi bacterium]|nr:SDR family oxidoreductase [Chloroflexota bacterium]
MIDLAGKVVAVTGAGRGLGEATALAFAAAKVRVACIDLDANAAEVVARRIRHDSGEALALALDVSDAAQVGSAVDRIVRQFGRLDFLVNNAGIDYTFSIEDLTAEQWDRVLAVNLRAPFLWSKAALSVMKGQGGGHIVNISSTAGKRAWANAAAYHASKWGLIGFTRALGVEGRPHNVRASLIVPGGMQTPFFDRLDVKPDPRNLQAPDNVARLIVYTVSVPIDSAIQEVIITPLTETSWP